MTNDTSPSEKKVRRAQIIPPVYADSVLMRKKTTVFESVQYTKAIRLRQRRRKLQSQTGWA